MPKFRINRPVAATPEQMYDVVCDVERYPEFLPMCEDLKVLSRQPTEDGVDVLVATMSVGYKSIQESFTTRVSMRKSANRILVEYLDGPFRYLENRWEFVAQPDGGCMIEFFIDYEFRSPMLGLLVGTMFDKAFRKFAEAFETRAYEIYGDPTLQTVPKGSLSS
ncbi:MAG: type II toxin-antitoxin system RatA family toxin [Hyphomicrobiaceae bacterium]